MWLQRSARGGVGPIRAKRLAPDSPHMVSHEIAFSNLNIIRGEAVTS